MKNVRLFLTLLSIFPCVIAFSQTTLSEKQQKIATNLQNYFAMDRENIHLHFNKNIYLNNERIWFKGYVLEKKNRPTQNTTNVYLNLWGKNGQKIASQLYFAENGLFDGYLNIPETIESGTYYIQAFTYFMNNFDEDESSIYPIRLVNAEDKNFGYQRKINYDELDVQFYPESGIFLENVSNTIGLHIADCSGLGIPIESIEVVDSQGKTIADTSTDQFGYGRFDIYNASRQNYSIRFKANGKPQQRMLPLPVPTGIAFSVNNYIYADKAAVKVKTNAATMQGITNNAFTLLIQQNDAVSFADIHFPSGSFEQNIIIPRSEISTGLNTIYLIDSNSKLMAERVIYDPVINAKKSVIAITQKRMDSIKIHGTSAIKYGTLSISVLPAAAVSQHPVKPIQESLVFDNYLLEPIEHLGYYLEDFNRKKHYELDNVLLTEKTKYNWDKMMLAAPEKKYESDFGLAVKGTLNANNIKGSIFKINMKSSALGFDEFKSLDAKNEFVFKNLLAIDSAKIYFLPKDKAGKILPHQFSFQIIDNNRRFNKTFTPLTKTCSAKPIYENTLPFPKIENAVLLDSINVVSKSSKLKYRNRIGNMTARSFKITDMDANKTLLSFIAANGFTVSKADGMISISSNIPGHNEIMRASTMSARSETLRVSLNGPSQKVRTTTRSGVGAVSSKADSPGPVVFIDDVMIPNYDILDDFNMSRIDEIYLNKHSNDISVFGSNGYIKIYTKRGGQSLSSPKGSPSVTIKNGFQKFIPFQNPKYDNVHSEGFQKLGTVFWNPIVETDENGAFNFAIPNLYQHSVNIIIEGIDADGIMISESLVLEIK